MALQNDAKTEQNITKQQGGKMEAKYTFINKLTVYKNRYMCSVVYYNIDYMRL